MLIPQLLTRSLAYGAQRTYLVNECINEHSGDLRTLRFSNSTGRQQNEATFSLDYFGEKFLPAALFLSNAVIGPKIPELIPPLSLTVSATVRHSQEGGGSRSVRKASTEEVFVLSLRERTGAI